MSTEIKEVSKEKREPTTVKEHINSEAFREKLRVALPKHLTPERFAGVALTQINTNPGLLNCTQESLFKCLLQLGQIGLEPDGRRAHLVPFGKECTLLIDYKGLVELALRNGDVARIHADVVYESEVDAGDFIYNRGRVEKHNKSLMPNRGTVVAAYAEVEFLNGSAKAEVMTREEIEAIRKEAKSANSMPWTKHWNEMAKKTVFRRLAKWLPLSPEIRESMEGDDDSQFSKMKRVAPARPMFKQIESAADEVVAEIKEVASE
jgi:recombination protein RecT